MTYFMVTEKFYTLGTHTPLLCFSFAVAAESARLQLSHGMPVKNSPGSKPGTLVLCERVHICGLSRLKYLGKFANTAKLKISATNSSIRIPAIEVCLHR